MDLSDDTLPTYLSERGLLRGRRVRHVDSTTRRSYCATVELDDSTRWFLKQARHDANGQLQADLDREATVHRWANQPSAAGLRSLLPALHLHDSANRVIVTEHLSAHHPLPRHRRTTTLSRTLAESLGDCLARCHTVTPAAVPTATDLPTAHQPPVPAWDDIGPELIAGHSDAFAELIEHLQNTPGLAAAIDRLQAAWTPSCLVHGDLKGDNLLWRPRRPGAGPDLRLIDWELAHWGDPTWDIGSIVGDYLQAWLTTLTPTPDGRLTDWVAAAGVPYSRVRNAIARFWTAYQRQSHLRPVQAEEYATRVVAAAGIFLIHRAIAAVLAYGSLSASALCSLQMAPQLIRSPEAAMRGLLQ